MSVAAMTQTSKGVNCESVKAICVLQDSCKSGTIFKEAGADECR
jgi:hypothetical protein